MPGRWVLRVLFLLLGIVTLVGCNRSTDSRMIGKWETRRGFANTLEVDFKPNGTLAMTSIEGKDAKSVKGRWYVDQVKGDRLIVQIKTKGSYRKRKIEFLNDDFFVMTASGGQTLGRFKRIERR